MSQLPPMVVRALASVDLDAPSRAALDTLLCWAFGLDGTLAMTGLGKVPAVLEALDRLKLEPGESEAQRQQIRKTIMERVFE